MRSGLGAYACRRLNLRFELRDSFIFAGIYIIINMYVTERGGKKGTRRIDKKNSHVLFTFRSPGGCTAVVQCYLPCLRSGLPYCKRFSPPGGQV